MAGLTIQSNSTGLAIAEEVIGSPKTLPGSPVWYKKEPNSYPDFGGEISTVAREPINPTRQNKRGTVVDLEAAGGFSVCLTQNNMIRDMQGFMYADAHEKPSTRPLNAAGDAITDVAASGVYNAAAGLDIFAVGDLVKPSGFSNAANNGFGKVTAAAAAQITTTIATVVEASPASDAKIEVCGYEFGSGDVDLAVAGGLATLTSATEDFTTFGLEIGEWVFLGGDAAINQFANGTGYFRIKEINATNLVFDKATDLKVTDAGAGKEIQMFFGVFQNNADDPDDIVCRTYQLERTLGQDANGTQSEYIVGAIPNELTLNIPTADKVTADLAYVGLDNETRDGLTGVKSGTRVDALAEKALNTTSNVVRTVMSIIDEGTLSPEDLFSYIQETTLTINNNASALKRVGALGGFDINIGNFVVGGSTTAYFETVAAIQAIRANSDVTIDIILAQDNAGMVFDIPMMGVGGGKANVEKDAPVTIPLENDAAENDAGYTLGFNTFPYLPDAAMPVAA